MSIELQFTKEQEIMNYLNVHVFAPVLESTTASQRLKQGCRMTVNRMKSRDARGMIQYYWSAIIGTERSIGFAAQLQKEGFDRFEEAIDEFRIRFSDDWLQNT